MAYEAEGRKTSQDLRAQHGKLLEAHLKPGRRIHLVFERGEWEVPSNFIFKYGYSGSGPDCFHAFLIASGFTVSKSAVENGQEGQVLSAPGHDPNLHVLVLDDSGLNRGSTQDLVDRARLHDEHEQAVKDMDTGNYRGAIAAFEKILSQIDSPDPMTFQNIAVCHAHLGEFGRSLGVLEQALIRWPDHHRLRMNYDGIKADAPRGTVPIAPSWARQDRSPSKETPPATAPVPAPPVPTRPASTSVVPVPPTKTDKCFIATAACGSASDWRVVALREFRDTNLRERRLGRLFIAAYERCSPPMASIVSRLPILRAAVRVFVVYPAVLLLAFLDTRNVAPRRDGQR